MKSATAYADHPPVVYFLTGQLREFSQFRRFASSLLERHPLVVATSLEFEEQSHWLQQRGAVVADASEPSETFLHSLIAEKPGVLQWWRFGQAAKRLYELERAIGWRFPVVRRIRSDWLFDNPDLHLKALPELEFDGLLAQSDLAFGGRREFVLPLVGMWEAAFVHFWGDRANRYLPINPWQVTKSDDATRWHWSPLDASVLGHDLDREQRRDVKRLRRRVQRELAQLVTAPLPATDEIVPPLGIPPWAAEGSFAQFLNFMGVPVRRHAMYTGTLAGRDRKDAWSMPTRLKRQMRKLRSSAVRR